MADPSDPQNGDVPFPARNANRVPSSPELVLDSVISRPLQEAMQARGPDPIGVVAELRNTYPGGIAAQAERVSGSSPIAPDAVGV
jgi:serine protease AprX